MLMAFKTTSLCCSSLNLTNSPRFQRAARSMNPTARIQTRIHRLIEDQGIVLMPGCYDALSAAIVQQTGFSAGFISGYALSASLLGKPDFGLLTCATIFLCIKFFFVCMLSFYLFSFVVLDRRRWLRRQGRCVRQLQIYPSLQMLVKFSNFGIKIKKSLTKKFEFLFVGSLIREHCLRLKLLESIAKD